MEHLLEDAATEAGIGDSVSTLECLDDENCLVKFVGKMEQMPYSQCTPEQRERIVDIFIDKFTMDYFDEEETFELRCTGDCPVMCTAREIADNDMFLLHNPEQCQDK